jgi:hypothetical protein
MCLDTRTLAVLAWTSLHNKGPQLQLVASTLQRPMLHLDVSTPHGLAAPGRVCTTEACIAPGCYYYIRACPELRLIWTTEACAAYGHVYTTDTCDATGRVYTLTLVFRILIKFTFEMLIPLLFFLSPLIASPRLANPLTGC